MMRKIKIIFVYQVPSFWPSWECLYEKLVEDSRFQVKVLWISDYMGDKAQMEGADKFLIYKKVPFENFTHEKVLDFHPDYMIYQTPYDTFHRPDRYNSIRYKRLGIKIVYIPYGIEISDTIESRYKHFSLPTVLNSDVIYTISDRMKEEYKKWCLNWKAVKSLGLPRIDSLLRDYPEIPLVRERRCGRKVILWKVHFPKVFVIDNREYIATPALEEYTKFVDYIDEHKELFFIFMPHPKFTDETIKPDLREKAIALVEKLKTIDNVYIDYSEDYRNSLTNADAIMVDRSAIMVEAGIKGVPVMYLRNSEYEEPLTAPVLGIIESYYYGETANDMIDFCENIKNGKDTKAKERKKSIEENIQYLDSRNSERIVEDLINMADIPTKTIKMIQKNSKFVIWGAGLIGNECLLRYLRKNEIEAEVVAWIDSSSEAQNREIHNYSIKEPDVIRYIDYDYVVVATEKYFREVYLDLTEKYQIPSDKIMGYDEFYNIIELGVEEVF